MKIGINLEKAQTEKAVSRNYEKALGILKELREDKEAYTGWVNRPGQIEEAFLKDMEQSADQLRSCCETLIVIGIGGSYLGTAAILEALGGSAEGCPELLYAGNNMSGSYLAQIAARVDSDETCLCVVSKSGNTMETKIAFSVLRDRLYAKYGDEAAKRIVAITDPLKGSLREEANERGYKTFEIPSNIGGRYSAFTAGILFPLLLAGVDVRALIKGAADAMTEDEFWSTEGLSYALSRYEMLEAGKGIEVFEYYDPSLRLIGEWIKQLFGESEGKEGKGLFPASLTFSTDLHSMGQYLQEGRQQFFETVINIVNRDRDVIIPESAGEQLAGRSLNEINQLARRGVIAAHCKAGIPIIQLDVEECNEYCLGQLLYFLMITAAVTGKLMGVDPFNQPGVEDYKSEIRKLLGQ